MSAFFLVITIAMAAAATMAWFTDNGTAEDAQFTAGTVSIEAGRKVICDGTDNNGEYAVRREVLPFRLWKQNRVMPVSTMICLSKRQDPMKKLS